MANSKQQALDGHVVAESKGSLESTAPDEGGHSSSDTVLQAQRRPGPMVEKSEDPKTNPVFPQLPPQPLPAPPPPPPPNGGYGWVCAVATAFINAQTWGLNSSYGVFLAHYLSNNLFPGATPLDYAFIGSLSISVAFVVSPVATSTTRYFGTRVTLFTGVVLETTGLIGASFATKTWHLFLSQGVCFGLGMGFLFIGSVPVTPQWFTTKRSLASAVASSGSGIGGLLYSLAVGAMIPSIGIAWTFRVLGILCFVVNSICTALMRDRNEIIQSSQLAFDTKILRRVEYMLLGGWGWFSMLGYVVLIFSLANYANSIGLSASQGAVISALFNLGQGLGRPPIGYFGDTIGRINMAMLTTFAAGVLSLVLWTNAKSYGVLIFFALVGGTVAGTFWCTVPPVTAEVVGLRHLPSGLNLMWITIALPVAFSEPIALEMVKGAAGRYLSVQLWTGFMYVGGALCLLLLRGWRIAELDEIAETKKRQQIVDDDDDDDDTELEAPEWALKAGRKKMWTQFWKWRKV